MSKKTKIVIIVVLVALVATSSFFIWRKKYSTSATKPSSTTGKVNTVNYEPPTEAQKKDGENTSKGSGSSGGDSGGSSSTTPTGTITISRVNQVVASGVISLRTIIDGVKTGNCAVSFSLSGQPTIQKTVAVAYNANYYSCNVDVPLSEFGASGNWSVSVHTIDSAGASTSNTATSNVEVQK